MWKMTIGRLLSGFTFLLGRNNRRTDKCPRLFTISRTITFDIGGKTLSYIFEINRYIFSMCSFNKSVEIEVNFLQKPRTQPLVKMVISTTEARSLANALGHVAQITDTRSLPKLTFWNKDPDLSDPAIRRKLANVLSTPISPDKRNTKDV